MKHTSVILVFVLSVFVCRGCGQEESIITPTSELLPELTIHDIEIERTKTQESGRFFIEMSSISKSDVTFNFLLAEGSAKFDTDFIRNSGTITIPAGQKTTSIEVFIKGNSLREENKDFGIVLSNPKGCTLKKSNASCTIIANNGEDLITSDIGYKSKEAYAGLSMVWRDEFNGNTLDLQNWNQEIGNGDGGWGNNELQYYTNSKKNTFVSNGNLIIEARRENLDGFKYSSGRMTSKGKREFTFGRFDVRAKLPKGKGIWPAIWMLGANISNIGWPACGEIDIMELIGSEPNKIHGTIHYRGANGHVYQGKDFSLSNGDFSSEFHVFSLIWEKDKIQWLVDDIVFYSIEKPLLGPIIYPFNDAQFFIFNLAVGGNWPGSPDANTVFPQRIFIDYIRVFQ
ncbi:MAG TPA: family 16 glycosylhydrolase [Saprospiraceae bacterium]|nr:family 16 glycosylhydrolase [Saprospiraceae bacterium]HMT68898.1 family 16 glycosylhydrolase [Saprospiraceae bacterium]